MKKRKLGEILVAEGLLTEGQLTEDALQDAVDQAVEIQTSPALMERIEKENAALAESPEYARDALESVLQSRLLTSGDEDAPGESS